MRGLGRRIAFAACVSERFCYFPPDLATMSWTSVIGQQRALTALRRTISADRIAHAWLFYGPEGVGKRAAAIAYGKALLCERGGEEGCGACSPCVKVDRMVHPDLHLLMPHPSDADPSDVAERIRLVGQNPYAAVDFVRRPSLEDPSRSSNKQALYTVARVQEDMCRAMSFQSVEGGYKVAVVSDAEYLRTDAANMFLKMLEEPPPKTVFILATSRPDRILSTILSRCRRLRFDPLPPEAIAQALIKREGVDPASAATLARMADGSYAAGIDLARNEDLRALRTLVLEFARAAYTRNVGAITDIVERIGRFGRDRVGHVLELLLRWIRDLMLYRTMGEAAPLVNVDQTRAIADFVAALPRADVEAMASVIEEAITLVRGNVHVSLTLTVLAGVLGEAMRGPHSGALYTPLSDAYGGKDASLGRTG